MFSAFVQFLSRMLLLAVISLDVYLHKQIANCPPSSSIVVGGEQRRAITFSFGEHSTIPLYTSLQIDNCINSAGNKSGIFVESRDSGNQKQMI